MPGAYPEKIRTLPPYDGRFDAYKLKAQGADVLFASYTAKQSIPEHAHETENYGVVIRGAMYLTVDGEQRCYDIGSWYHIPANQKHAAQFVEDTDIIEFWFD